MLSRFPICSQIFNLMINALPLVRKRRGGEIGRARGEEEEREGERARERA
jgi:hypothetical protein